jgi:hypothetical protein
MKPVKLRKSVSPFALQQNHASKMATRCSKGIRRNGDQKRIWSVAAGLAVFSCTFSSFMIRGERPSSLPNTALTKLSQKNPIDRVTVFRMKDSIDRHYRKWARETNQTQECSLDRDRGREEGEEVTPCEPLSKEDIDFLKNDIDKAFDEIIKSMNDLSVPNRSSPGGAMLIAYLALAGDENTLQDLKKEGFNLNQVDPFTGNTAIHLLAGGDDCRCRSRHQLQGIQLLIRLGADVNIPNGDGMTALDLLYSRITTPGVFDGMFAQSKKNNLNAMANSLIQAKARSPLYQLNPMMVAGLRGDFVEFREELARNPKQIFQTAIDGRNLPALVEADFFLGKPKDREPFRSVFDEYGVSAVGPNDIDAWIKFVLQGGG